MIKPDVYLDELIKIGITEDSINEAVGILNGALSYEYLNKLKKDFENKNKGGTLKYFNANRILKCFVSADINDTIWLIKLANILKDFSNSPNINGYISRIKDNLKINPAIYELLSAHQFYLSGLPMELEKENYLGNPVEFYFEHDKIQYWFECKSYEITHIEESLEQKINRKSKNILDTLEIGCGIYIELNDIDFNKKNIGELINTLKTQSGIIFSKISNEEEILRTKQANITFYRYGIDLFQDIVKSVLNKSDDFGGNSKVKKKNNSINLPEYTNIGGNPYLDNFIGISLGQKKVLEDKTNNRVSKMVKNIEGKYMQQKNIIEKDNNELILLFDKNLTLEEYGELIPRVKGKFNHLDNLSIMITSFLPNKKEGEIVSDFIPVMMSYNFNKIFTKGFKIYNR